MCPVRTAQWPLGHGICRQSHVAPMCDQAVIFPRTTSASVRGFVAPLRWYQLRLPPIKPTICTLGGILLMHTLCGIFTVYTPKGMLMKTTAQTPKQLGQILKGQRKSQALTQQKTADRVGLLPKTISKLELDTETSTIESLYKLLSALELELVVQSKSQESSDKEW